MVYIVVTERVVIGVMLQNCVCVVSVSNFCLVVAYPAYGFLRFLLENSGLILRGRRSHFASFPDIFSTSNTIRPHGILTNSIVK